MTSNAIAPPTAGPGPAWPAASGHPQRWRILTVLAAVAFMAQLDLFIVNIAVLPRAVPARRAPCPPARPRAVPARPPARAPCPPARPRAAAR